MAALRIWLAMGTSFGSAARIAAVGASNSGFTSANHSAPPLNSSRCRSNGLALLDTCDWCSFSGSILMSDDQMV